MPTKKYSYILRDNVFSISQFTVVAAMIEVVVKYDNGKKKTKQNRNKSLYEILTKGLYSCSV